MGEGGFGHVYLAHHPRLGVEVALKLARPQRFARPGEAERFVEEAKVAASLRHPGIVIVHDVDRDGETYFIVQEFLSGGTLDERLRRRPMEPKRIGHYLIPVAEALAHAHRNGVYHRDIKPANILLDQEDRPKVADFGLAMRHQARGDNEGLRVGTPGYMSPEQVRGESNRIDGRTDIWALGVILYQMLTGQKPFAGSTRRELYHAVIHVDPPPPSQFEPSTPPALERVCLKCLEKLASDRYVSASDLAVDLRYSIDEAATLTESQSVARGVAGPAIIPKFLRSYDRHDADFFLRLLPGPHDRDGIPESIRFWKSWVETDQPSAPSAVGFLYGPSGSGKSSIIRAGLLPRVGKGVRVALVESSRDRTEHDVKAELCRSISCLPRDASLPEMVGAIREGHLLYGKEKVLIVLDQFEQWLHANEARLATADGVDLELIGALRQADGGHVQFVLVLRDDFSMTLNRVCQLIEVPLLAGVNFATVDRFDQKHARKVLIELGRGYETLPPRDDLLTPAHHQFLDHALRLLSEAGRVVSIRLSLFAHMLRDKEWSDKSLRQMGGAEGIGLEFLDQTFLRAGGNPKYRSLAPAAIRILASMLPDAGEESSRLKGRRRSRDELAEIAGLDAHELEGVIDVLDRELGLITPTDAIDVMLSTHESAWSAADSAATAVGETSDTNPARARQGTLAEDNASDADNPSPKKDGSDVAEIEPDAVATQYYQLTHDFLVPTLDRWLTRQRSATRGGRWTSRLEKLAERYDRQPRRQRLPSFWEHLQIRLWTRPSDRNDPQRRMLEHATRWHATYFGAALAFVGLVWMGLSQLIRDERVDALAKRWADADPSTWPALLAETNTLGAAAEGRLKQDWASKKTDADSPSRLPLAFALADQVPEAGNYLRGQLSRLPPATVARVANRLDLEPGDATTAIPLISDDDAESTLRRAIIAANAISPQTNATESLKPSRRDAIVSALTEVPARSIAAWTDELRPLWDRLWPGVVAQFESIREVTRAPSIRSPYALDERRRDNLAAVAIEMSAGNPDRIVNVLPYADDVNRKQLFDFAVNHVAWPTLEMAATGWLSGGPRTAFESDEVPDQVSADTVTRRFFERFGGLVHNEGAFVQRAPWREFESLSGVAAKSGWVPQSIRPHDGASSIRVAATWHGPPTRWTIDASPLPSAEEFLEAQARQSVAGYYLVDFARAVVNGKESWFGLWHQGEKKTKWFVSSDDDSDAWERDILEDPDLGDDVVLLRYDEWIDDQGRARAAGLYGAADVRSDASIENAKNRSGSWTIVNRLLASMGDLLPGKFNGDVRLRAVRGNIASIRSIRRKLSAYRRAEQNRPERRQGYRMRLAEFERWLGNHERALEYAEAGLADAPTSPTFSYLRGMAQWRLGDLSAARKTLRAIGEVADDPDPMVALLNLRLAVVGNDGHEVERVIAQTPPALLADLSTDFAAQWHATLAQWFHDHDDDRYEESCQAAVAAIRGGKSFQIDYSLANPIWSVVRESSVYAKFLNEAGVDRSCVALWTRQPDQDSRMTIGVAPDEFSRLAKRSIEAGFIPTIVHGESSLSDQEPLTAGIFVKRSLPGPVRWNADVNAAWLLARIGKPAALRSLLAGDRGPDVRSLAMIAGGNCGIDADVLQSELMVEDSASDPDSRSATVQAILLILGEFPRAAISRPVRAAIVRIARLDADAATVSAARWLLRRWGQPIDPSPPATVDLAFSEPWYELPAGGRMLRIVPPEEHLYGIPQTDPSWSQQDNQIWMRIPRSYYMSATEFTVDQLNALLRSDQSFLAWYTGDDSTNPDLITTASTGKPLTRVDFFQVLGICQKLSELSGMPEAEQCFPGLLQIPLAQLREGELTIPADVLERKGYRPPTRAEWEFACRGKIETAFHFGSDPRLMDWFGHDIYNSDDRIHRVALKRPNANGFFDMHGNAAEWMIDCQKSSANFIPAGGYRQVDSAFDALYRRGDQYVFPNREKRFMRGGSFRTSWRRNHAAYDQSPRPQIRNDDFGLRLARTAEPLRE